MFIFYTKNKANIELKWNLFSSIKTHDMNEYTRSEINS